MHVHVHDDEVVAGVAQQQLHVAARPDDVAGFGEPRAACGMDRDGRANRLTVDRHLGDDEDRVGRAGTTVGDGDVTQP